MLSEVAGSAVKVEEPVATSEVVDGATVSEVEESVIDTTEEPAPPSELIGGTTTTSEVDEGMSEDVAELNSVAVSTVEPPVERGIPVDRGIPVERGIVVESGIRESMTSCGRGFASTPLRKRKDKKRDSMAEEGNMSSPVQVQ